MWESILTQYVRAIRQKNNISDIKAAHRCGVSLSEYILLEKSVETLSLIQLKSIFEAIEMTQQEFVEYQALIQEKEQEIIENLSVRK